MNPIAVVLMGLIMTSCIFWFIRILRHDKRLRRPLVYDDLHENIIVGLCFTIIASFFAIVPVSDIMQRMINVPPSMWEAKWFLIFPYTQPSRIYNDFIATLSWRVTGSLLLLVITSSCLYFVARTGLRRLLVPIVISAVLLIGALVYNSASLFDPNYKAASSWLLPYEKQFDIPLAIHKIDIVSLNLSKVCVLTLSLLLKTYLGPIITGYVFSAELYSVFVYGKFQPIPILTSILDWVFEGFPFWASSLYLVIQVTYNILLNGIQAYL